MSETFYISDTHFNHERILTFTDHRGNPVRPEFKNAQEMNETMIYQWNNKVGPNDVVWHLGDVFFGSQAHGLDIVRKLNGRKKLIFGNHDSITPEWFYVFESIELWRKDRKNDVIFSHMPLHNSVLNELSETAINVHGHIHSNDSPTGLYGRKRWINISVEKINYTPITLDEIRKMIKE